ncbi:MAG TPA: hypothetical protein VEF04_00960 [Blastocatellia bacterium]|nr:hypothetical protein [Blastocatellia bacterium]
MPDKLKAESENCPSMASVTAHASILPECCNSGCTVCVLDYPELCLSADREMLAMLEAVEEAERKTAQLNESENPIV